MALIKDLSSIPDLAPVVDGEYDIRVKKVNKVESKKTPGRFGIQLICEVVDEPEAETLFHTLWLPYDGDEEETANTMWRMIKDFTTPLGLSGDLDLEDFEDLQFTAFLKYTDDPEYGIKNEIGRVTG